MSSRTSTTEGTLARLGFADPRRAAALLDDRALLPLRAAFPDGQLDDLVAVVGDTADPDQGLLGLVRVAESLAAQGDPSDWGISSLSRELATDGVGRERVMGVLGEHVFDFFLRNKRQEWLDYRHEISQFELNRYLPRL